MDGMFMDGQIYATVAHNLALGDGSFWDPTFCSTSMTSYHEQPPLLFGMESLLFRLLGSSLYVERIWCLLTALFSAWGIARIWRMMFHDQPLQKQIELWPIGLWFIIPVCFWSYINHVEEGTMVIFTLLSAEWQLKVLIRKAHWTWFLAAGVAALAAGFCKGVQGMFVLVLAPLFALITKEINFKRGLLGAVLVTATAVGVMALFWTQEVVQVSFEKYFQDRILRTFLQAGVATSENRLHLLYELLINLIAPLLITVLIAFFHRPQNRRRALFFIALGFSGTIPLLITLEQRGFYLTTTLPFYAIGLALLTANPVAAFFHSGRYKKMVLPVAAIIFIGTIAATIYFAGQPKRDVEILHDVYKIGPVVGHYGEISAPEEICETWSLRAYLARHYQIGITAENNRAFVLTKANAAAPEGYAKVPLVLRKYVLWEKQ